MMNKNIPIIKVPKVVFVSAFILISLPWIGDNIETYTKDLWDLILVFGN